MTSENVQRAFELYVHVLKLLDEQRDLEDEYSQVQARLSQSERYELRLMADCYRECKEVEVEWFGKWIDEQRALGRRESELTWGACVKESGIWKPKGGTSMSEKLQRCLDLVNSLDGAELEALLDRTAQQEFYEWLDASRAASTSVGEEGN